MIKGRTRLLSLNILCSGVVDEIALLAHDFEILARRFLIEDYEATMPIHIREASGDIHGGIHTGRGSSRWVFGPSNLQYAPLFYRARPLVGFPTCQRQRQRYLVNTNRSISSTTGSLLGARAA